MSNLDPVTLTVIQNGLIQVCNEMDLAFVRSAFSPVISEGMDRSDGIYDALDGSLIAQGELGLPVFVGTMQFSTQAVIDRVKSHYAGKVDPGDVFIVNDPYLGGTHLMDVRFVKPFFYKGELFAWLANTGHWPDVGGMVPGGFSASATEVEQEGLRLPPVKFWKKGEMDQEILSIILSNIRIADQRIGDIKAQAAALTTGEVRLTALIDRYGADVVQQAIAEMRHRAERQMRAKISDIPDGVYEGTSQIDSDGVVDQPLTIKMKITKKGDELTFDMTGSSPPCRGPMNSVIATTKSAIYLAIKHIFPEVPINAGTFEPLKIVEPHGTFLYARYPRPVSGCAAEVSQRIAEAVFAALTHAIPDLLFAAPAGTSGNLGVGGFDPERNRSYIMYLFTGGGYGGFQGGDGLSQRLLDHRHLQDAAGRGAGAVLSDPVRGVLVARRLRRRRRVPRRLRHQLRDQAAPRRGAGVDGDGPWPQWPAGRAGRRGRRRQHRVGRPEGQDLSSAASQQGPGHRDRCRRRGAGLDAGWRRLRRSGAAPSRGDRARRRARLLHCRTGRREIRRQMTVLRRGLLAVPLLALAGGARAQKKLVVPITWYAVRVEDNAFTVEMPGIPDHRIVNDVTARGTTFTLHSYSLEIGGYSYVAQTALYPVDVDVTQPRTILQAALNGRVQQLVGRKWTSVEWREIAGAAAVESVGALAGGNALRQLNLLKERRFVSLAFLGNAAGVKGVEAERFFKSLKMA